MTQLKPVSWSLAGEMNGLYSTGGKLRKYRAIYTVEIRSEMIDTTENIL